MLRPKRMSKVSVTGSRAVMGEAIEAIHGLRRMHFSDYDGTIEGFEAGDPLQGADDVADLLVTVRSLESILGVTAVDGGQKRILDIEEIREKLEPIRRDVNELDDRRSALEDELESVEERIDGAEPFVDLGYDLELLSGYDHLEVAVGEGSVDDVVDAIEGRDDVEAFDVETTDDVVAVFVAPTDPETGVVDDALVGVEFERVAIPDAEGAPEAYVDSLRADRNTLESKLRTVESELEDRRHEHGAFLLSAEEKLTIEVQKAEIPLQFATTEHAFVAEGWLPTDEVEGLHAAVDDATDGRVEIEELEVAGYSEYAEDHHGPEEAAADGGAVFDEDDEPPVIQDNPGIVKPFEVLVQVINRPRYSELDPTIVLFLTMPAFFGFMIGDVGYGLFYVAVSYWLTKRFDGAIKRLGEVGLWLGGFTVFFGLLYGEVFGLEWIAATLWAGHPPLSRGFKPAFLTWAQLWITLSVIVGLAHLTVGFVFDFVTNLTADVRTAVEESGSWLLLMFGVWFWIFSTDMGALKPEFLFQVFDGHPIPLGFAGLPPVVGQFGLGMAVVGFALLLYSEGIVGLVESLNVLTHVLSYTRLAAEVLAEGGIAFVIDLLFFGAYAHEGEFHYLIGESASTITSTHPGATVMFGGLLHGGIAAILAGILVLIFGHLMVLALGITSAGMQAIRLQYVEFFGKFYNGGGANYEPFGYDRSYTTQD